VKKLLLIPAVLAALGLSAVGANASIPAPNGTINGCYNPSVHPHPLDIRDSTATCPTGDISLNFNQTGPAGPQGATGAQGPAGATGATGPQGPAGTSGGSSTWVEASQHFISDDGSDTVSVTASCPSGDASILIYYDAVADTPQPLESELFNPNLGGAQFLFINDEDEPATLYSANYNYTTAAAGASSVQVVAQNQIGNADTYTLSPSQIGLGYTINVWILCTPVTNEGSAPPVNSVLNA
jgi:hypothetical protein